MVNTLYSSFDIYNNTRISNMDNEGTWFSNSFKHGIVFLGLTASLTTLRLVHKALFSIELLLSGRKNEFLIAVLADESLVFVHFVNLA